MRTRFFPPTLIPRSNATYDDINAPGVRVRAGPSSQHGGDRSALDERAGHAPPRDTRRGPRSRVIRGYLRRDRLVRCREVDTVDEEHRPVQDVAESRAGCGERGHRALQGT